MLFGVSLLCSVMMQAVPAKPGPISVTQPDGTEITINMIGDEYGHQCFSTDGYLLANIGGFFYYADLDDAGNVFSTGIRAAEPSKRAGDALRFLAGVDRLAVKARLNATLKNKTKEARKSPFKGPGLTGKSYFPSKGKQKAIVILVEYTDCKFHEMDNYNPHDYFSRMMMEPGFSDFGGTGSARDFFIASSNGQFEPEFDVYGPLTLSKHRAYYGENTLLGGRDINAHRMVIEACQMLDGSVDFTQYDRDGDGYIDNVFVFYAGEGEHMGATSDSVWPHAYKISEKDNTPYIFDGVRLDRYGCTSEWVGKRPDGVGTFVHEFSHIMGLPDLYTTDYSASFTPGPWSTLDAGPYNNDGCTPPLYSAYERYALDWLTPVEINSSMSVTLSPMQCNMAGIIRTDNENEYYLVENRQREGWDKFLPNSGMLVWHVDYNKSIWYSNSVNNNPDHQYVDLVEADNLQTIDSRAGDSFPGLNGVTSFTDNTVPSMRSWSNKSINLPITEIEEADGLISFNVNGGGSVPAAPVSLEPDEIDSEGFTALWKMDADQCDYLFSLYTLGENEAPEYVDGYYRRNVGKNGSLKLENLMPATTYYYQVHALKGLSASAGSNIIKVYTDRMPLDRLTVDALEAENVTSSGFVARWEALEEADRYNLTVYKKVPGGTLSDLCDFTGGISALPEGWVSTTPTMYSMSSYAGGSAPSLRMSADGDNLTTRVYDDGLKGVSFWHRGNATGDEDRISLLALCGKEWKEMKSYPVTTAKGGETISFTDIPEDASSFMIKFVRKSEKGNLALDDVTVEHGVKYVPQNLAGYDPLAVGDRTEMEVKGLEPDTEYYYMVSASDGKLVSKMSKEIAVKTTGTSSVRDIPGKDVSVSVEGLSVRIYGANEGAQAALWNVSGVKVAQGMAGQDGVVVLSPGTAGAYILTMPTRNLCVKIIVHP